MTEATGTVLVGVDDTPQAWLAADWATREAALRGAALQVVHAVTDADERVRGAAADLLQDARTRITTAHPGLRIDTVLGHQEPAGAVLTAAEDTDAGLIALGTRGRRGFAGLLLGFVSVADELTSSVIRGMPGFRGSGRGAWQGVDACHWAAGRALVEHGAHRVRYLPPVAPPAAAIRKLGYPPRRTLSARRGPGRGGNPASLSWARGGFSVRPDHSGLSTPPTLLTGNQDPHAISGTAKHPRVTEAERWTWSRSAPAASASSRTTGCACPASCSPPETC
ncbi:universal stress protein [Streptomyces sp. DG2A-72]|uniref:universal stress protein n=1 Tax=Streptomyces sp. DG2A-72 TaxID=3051386 RepID=UPI00265BAD46|nr:universal stress protein [Streptomyces sp. DG2A-72]MDO0931089.1 universal stress protein [Streptomyces sp. DG2A-72]